jgi:hypothetical protein
MDNNNVKIFFRYLIIGFLISSCKLDLINKTPTDIVISIFTAFMYNFIVGIATGLMAMFTVDIYFAVKKNGRSESSTVIV